MTGKRVKERVRWVFINSTWLTIFTCVWVRDLQPEFLTVVVIVSVVLVESLVYFVTKNAADIRSSLADEKARTVKLEEALAEETAERNNLQEILDSRPAINAGLPDSYIRWSQSIYSGEFSRAVIATLKQPSGSR